MVAKRHGNKNIHRVPRCISVAERHSVRIKCVTKHGTKRCGRVFIHSFTQTPSCLSFDRCRIAACFPESHEDSQGEMKLFILRWLTDIRTLSYYEWAVWDCSLKRHLCCSYFSKALLLQLLLASTCETTWQNFLCETTVMNIWVGASARWGMYCNCGACDRPRGGWAAACSGIW